MRMGRFSIKAIIICSLFFILNLFDTISTHILITHGIAREANPLMALVIAKGGFISLYIVKILLGVAVWILFVKNWHLKLCRIGSYILVSVYGLLGLYHISGWIYVISYR